MRSVTVGLFVRAGSRFEGPGEVGLSHFLEHMLFRGTRNRPSAFAINDAIEQLATTLEGMTMSDSTVLSMTLPADAAPPAIELLGEIVREPVFADIEVEKRIVREEILEGLDEDGHDVDPDDVSRHQLFSPHPLGQKITGDLRDLSGISKADLERHLRRFYVADNAVLSVAGAYDEGAVREAAAHAFGDLDVGQRAETSAPTLDAERERFVFVHDEGSQTDLRLAFTTPGLFDPRAPALRLLERILDDGMSTRVHRRIIDERGLAYDAFGAIELYEDVGVLNVGAAVAHEKAEESLEALMDLCRELRDDGLCDGELDKAKRRALWDLSSLVDDADAMASFYGEAKLLGRDVSPPLLAAKIEATTAAEVEAVAREIFSKGRVHVAAVGVEKRTRVRAMANRIADY